MIGSLLSEHVESIFSMKKQFSYSSIHGHVPVINFKVLSLPSAVIINLFRQRQFNVGRMYVALN